MNKSSVVATCGSVNRQLGRVAKNDARTASARRRMEILWTPRAFPVDGATPKIFFRDDRVSDLARSGLCIRFREPLRLIVRAACIQFHRSPNIQATHVADTVYRFRESIAGRTYLIEVKPVSD